MKAQFLRRRSATEESEMLEKEKMMRGNAKLLLGFALMFAVFILGPPLLGQPFPPNRLMHWADVFDLFTPLVLIPLYWLIFTNSGMVRRNRGQNISFILLAGLWVEGQAMHLAANSIGNLLGSGETEVHQLIHFYDEVLSHYIWHVAILGLSILLLFLSHPPKYRPTNWAVIGPAGVIYGITCFLAFIEGATVPLSLPAVALTLLGILIWKRKFIRIDNTLALFFLGYLIAAVLFTAWGLYWGGFPEFTEVGLL